MFEQTDAEIKQLKEKQGVLQSKDKELLKPEEMNYFQVKISLMKWAKMNFWGRQ